MAGLFLCFLISCGSGGLISLIISIGQIYLAMENQIRQDEVFYFLPDLQSSSTFTLYNSL